MNVHSPRWFERWQPHEEAAIISLRADGNTHKAIAEILGRTVEGVRMRAGKLRTGRGKPIPPFQQDVKHVPPRMSVLREQLPLFYACGWRVESFNALHCYLVWPNQSEPRIPEAVLKP